ncbi:hypothetical protein WV31_05830 [Magnetospirillum sp. ME-1]|uniref:TylF/MycF/NovP-related O-methyltransferase n=1 Tax=Magnetospirillum sp. ME-1 TaxID=1639348 RepID=UPI000A17CC9C|nr:TylF/MycF/NovP-related O-methyltransferase [Magnetospirillum sp. ME-1]ARJ65208.1 hypothetical protein WV31_05830 [Magnetospirillum sp. ME-1]
MFTMEFGENKFEYPDIDNEFFISVMKWVQPYTITSYQGATAQWALFQAIEYIVKHKIEGDIVECGVWQGGSMLMAALALRNFGDESRQLWLYDTFAGMPMPSEIDKRWDGIPTIPMYLYHRSEGRSWGMGGTVDHVRSVVGMSHYPSDKLVFVEGMVEETIPGTAPDKISLLRLDTDLYQSTYHELVHLYPRLVPGGVLIIDDYGMYQGAKAAVDQYFSENSLPVFLNRVDESVRLVIKPGL